VRDTALAIRDILADPTFVAPTELPTPPTRIAGKGDRLLAIAAKYAEIVMVGPDVTETVLAERIDYVRSNACDRVDDITFGFAFGQLALDDTTDLQRIRRLKPDATDEEIRAMPTVLTGTLDDAVAQIERIRQLGVDYLTLIRTPEVSWNTLGQLMTALRQTN
jgi:alkanesulfonate monooxygenase SsuD/methylene tetrahydromethanopterin reductase-like flavin-dependent oxidoreductase (luciferase family)